MVWVGIGIDEVLLEGEHRGKRQTGSRERVTSTLSIYCHIGFSLCLYLYFLLLTVLVLYHLDIYLQMSPIENKKYAKSIKE